MIESHDKGTLLHIKARTHSKKRNIEVTEEGCQVWVKAPPARGQANQEVIRVIAKKLEISSQRIRIVAGEKSKKKILLIEGLEPEVVLTFLQT